MDVLGDGESETRSAGQPLQREQAESAALVESMVEGVVAADERGRIVEGRRYRHNEPGIRALCARLVRLRVALVALL